MVINYIESTEFKDVIEIHDGFITIRRVWFPLRPIEKADRGSVNPVVATVTLFLLIIFIMMVLMINTTTTIIIIIVIVINMIINNNTIINYSNYKQPTCLNPIQ